MLSARQVSSRAASARAPISCRPHHRLVARAVEQDTQQSGPTVLSQSAQQAEGYVEKDTAGQSNMYPTVMRPFEAGGEQEDKTSKAAAEDTAKLAGGAGAAAVLVVIAGLAALTLSGGQSEQPAAEYLTLSAYSAKFSKELGITKPAPAPAPVAAPVPAPAVEITEEVVVTETLVE